MQRTAKTKTAFVTGACFTGAALRRTAISIGLVAAALGGCAGPAQRSNFVKTRQNLASFVAAANDATACAAAAAANPPYASLTPHMPLDNIGHATLPQMTDPSLATRDEVAALVAWTSSVNDCRMRLLNVTETTLPGFGPLIERGRDEDDAVFVKIAEHKISWGEAVLALKANRTKLRREIIAKAEQIDTDLDKLQQKQIDRQTTLLSSAIRILP